MLDRYHRWLVDIALPFWASQGRHASGYFHERLDSRGAPVALPHRAMVQARQIFVYAHAASQGWFDGADQARQAMALLRQRWCTMTDDGVRIVFAIDPASGQVSDSRQDTYSYAFVLFAAAHLYALDRDDAILSFAGDVSRYLDTHLTDRIHGGLHSYAPEPPAEKLQNPHMHLLEAWLALHAVAPARGYGDRARALVTFFRDKIVTGHPPLIPERFLVDWSSTSLGTRPSFEPGHHFEWAWLLSEADRQLGGETHALQQSLFSMALKTGRNRSGLVYDEADAISPVVTSYRLWPLTEGIKSALILGQRTLADQMASTLLDHFVGAPFPAGWIDRRAPDGAPLVDTIPASSLYHLMMAASVAASSRS